VVRSRVTALLRRNGDFFATTAGASEGFLDNFRVVKTVFLECCYFTLFSIAAPESKLNNINSLKTKQPA
jgi:hypothetical protein